MAQGGVLFRYHSSTGRSDLRGVFRKVDSDLDLGDYWDEVNLVFATSPTVADTEITLTETGSTGFYSAKSSQLGTYTGRGLKLIRDTTSGLDPESQYEDVWIANGVESTVAPSSSLTTTATIAAGSTWDILADGGTGNTITATSSDQPTLAMDFSSILGADTITAASTIVVTQDGTSTAMSILSRVVNSDGDQVHIQVSNLTSGVTYTIGITVTTTNGNTYTGYGPLQVT